MDISIEQIETTTGATVKLNPAETGGIIVEGPSDEAIIAAEKLLREHPAEVMAALRTRAGLSPTRVARREIALEWCADAQVAKQRAFAARNGNGYFQWSEDELNGLRDFLQPGDVVCPTYAMSCFIKRGSGEIHYRKDGAILSGE